MGYADDKAKNRSLDLLRVFPLLPTVANFIPHFPGSFSEFLCEICLILFLRKFLLGSAVWVCLIIRNRKALFLAQGERRE